MTPIYGCSLRIQLPPESVSAAVNGNCRDRAQPVIHIDLLRIAVGREIKQW
jgi:hypothetical protein